MYNLSYYKEQDIKLVMDFMHSHPFALLSGCDAMSRPVATQVPVLLENRNGRLYLLGHVMKNTDHYNVFLQNQNVLAIFTGPHTYVSASWYSNPQTGSTWNYITVHARGAIKFLDDSSLLKILRRLTSHFENDPTSPALVEKMPDEYINRMLPAIRGFEIEVLELDNVFKLSQNRDAESFENIVRNLQASDDPDAIEIAREMRKRRV
jgi:transcriptional regulator